MTDTYADRIGGLIRDARKHRGLTQTQLADVLGTSQSAVHRIEAGNQNLSLDMVNRIAEALESPLITVGPSGPLHLRVQGGAKLSGSIAVRSSKNAAVALLCASLINRGRTVIRGIAKIEEVNRILEVLTSIGVRAIWLDGGDDLELIRPDVLDLDAMDVEAARRLVASEVTVYLAKQRAQTVTPTVVALRRMAAGVVESEMARLERRTHLDEATAREVRNALKRVSEKLIHSPTVRVREFAEENEDVDYAAALRNLFALEPAQVATSDPDDCPILERRDQGAERCPVVPAVGA